jgi:hypothetical protein
MNLRRAESARNIGRTATALLLAFVPLTLVAPALRAQYGGYLAADRARLAEITGDTMLLRAPRIHRLSSLLSADFASRVNLMLPETRVTYNSDLPYSLNDGALWAGRGWNFSANAGASYEHPYRNAIIRVAVAPTVAYSQNLPFQVFPNTTPGRSAWANPFHGSETFSIDLPHRFGDRHVLLFDPGQSGISVAFPQVTAGATTERAWWGPALRNTLIMSYTAAGVPRWFVRTTKPVRTRAGDIDAELIAGTLTQSLFFSRTASENRTLSGVRVRLRPAFDSTLTVGFARVVYVPVGEFASPFTATLSHAFDVFTRWENLDPHARSDQIASLFARWIFPPAGFEVYGEWARMALPLRPLEMLEAPNHSSGYTLGFQWAPSVRGRGSYVRLNAEITYLEQSNVLAGELTPDFYTGIASPQGYTQRGQPIGAGIGPGASAQQIGADYIAHDWQAGVFVGRIRWDNDAMYRQPAPTFWRHDVSIMSGLRGGWRAPFYDFSAELTFARRLNYLFQNGFANPGGFRTVDVSNFTFMLVATPR